MQNWRRENAKGQRAKTALHISKDFVLEGYAKIAMPTKLSFCKLFWPKFTAKLPNSNSDGRIAAFCLSIKERIRAGQPAGRIPSVFNIFPFGRIPIFSKPGPFSFLSEPNKKKKKKVRISVDHRAPALFGYAKPRSALRTSFLPVLAKRRFRDKRAPAKCLSCAFADGPRLFTRSLPCGPTQTA